MRKTEDIVCYDFQGWPEYKMNLREILLALGGQQDGNFIKFPSNTPLMDIYPRILVDDGMGYGVDENVIVSVDIDSHYNAFSEKAMLKSINLSLFTYCFHASSKWLVSDI